MKKKARLLVSGIILVFICVASLLPASAASLYDTDNETLYNNDTGAQAAYVWTDLTYNSSTNKMKADCWINYKNSYPNVLHNCTRLTVHRSSGGALTYYGYSNSARNVVVEKTAPSGFTWCYNDHGINTCVKDHTYTYASNCDAVTLFTYVRLS